MNADQSELVVVREFLIYLPASRWQILQRISLFARNYPRLGPFILRSFCEMLV